MILMLNQTNPRICFARVESVSYTPLMISEGDGEQFYVHQHEKLVVHTRHEGARIFDSIENEMLSEQFGFEIVYADPDDYR